jgi:hypothetical protein
MKSSERRRELYLGQIIVESSGRAMLGRPGKPSVDVTDLLNDKTLAGTEGTRTGIVDVFIKKIRKGKP